ncbi:MAG: TetR/AcrR family transcriptional regulator; helix-turn-helix transcriptional regulator [Actinobacteria bacterium]|nr:TetR/AcrR family transcriptional regulator; helix-turn-helix transcriptional regulator [Actinomycetota bacterium]
METFSRFGYRKTSMDDVAKAAHISRPGLYFLFDSKPALFREAVAHALNRDLRLIAQHLSGADRSLSERLIAAFDLWAGSYIGPLTQDLPGAMNADPSILGTALDDAPRQFEELVINAIARSRLADGADRARTLISTSIGIKHQVPNRAEYLDRLGVAVAFLLDDATAR